MNNTKISVVLLIVLVGFPQISETIYTPSLPSVAKGLSTNAYMVEASLAIFFLGFAIGVSVWGAISDWCGRRKAMLIGLMIYIFGTFLCGNVSSVESLLVWRFIQAFGASVGSVITQTILRDAYDGQQRSKLFSLMSGALAFSPAIGPVLGGFISEYFGWRANFSVLATMGCIILIWSFLSLPETRPLQLSRPTFIQVKNLLSQMIRSSNLWGHVILIGSTNGIIFGFYQEAPFVFIEHLGMKSSYYGFLGLLISAAAIFAARISYQMAARSSPETMIRYGMVTTILGSMMFILTVMLGLLSFANMGIAVALFALFAIFIGIGLIIPNSLSIALKPYKIWIGIAGSFFGGLYYCLIACFTWLMSLLHDGTVFPLPVYILMLSGVLFIGFRMVVGAKNKEPIINRQ
jgi:Bcr/CflA subfamily drug resistance transporter